MNGVMNGRSRPHRRIAMDQHRGSEAHRNPVHRRDDRLVEVIQRGERAHLRALAGTGGFFTKSSRSLPG